jgi:hypothetical protein
VINGISVSVSQVGGCWQYRDSCLSASSLNYCAPFESLPQCSNTSLTCIQQDSTFNSGCMKYTATWRCGDPLASTPIPWYRAITIPVHARVLMRTPTAKLLRPLAPPQRLRACRRVFRLRR